MGTWGNYLENTTVIRVGFLIAMTKTDWNIRFQQIELDIKTNKVIQYVTNQKILKIQKKSLKRIQQ